METFRSELNTRRSLIRGIGVVDVSPIVTELCPCGRPRRSEQLYEEQLPQGYRKAWRSESVTCDAVPSYAQLPHQPAELSGLWLCSVAAMVVVWAAVGAVFWQYYTEG